MPEEVRDRYLAARRSARMATVAMSIIGALQLAILVAYLLAIPEQGIEPVDWLQPLSVLSTFGSTVLLASFFWCFGRDRSPFGRRQSFRLAGAGALFLMRMTLDALIPPAVANGTPGLTEHPEVNLQIVTIIVFLGCLAMVMRYGEALKEDSDSIA